LQVVESSLDKSQELLAAGDTAGAVREFSKLSKLGKLSALGQLGSYAQTAVQADSFAQKLVEQGRTALTEANEKLGQDDTRLEGALVLAETKRIYNALPPLKNDIVAAASAARTNPELRDTLKLAEQLDEARDLQQEPAGQRRAVTALNRIIAENPGTPAARLAGDWLQAENLAAPAVAKTFRSWTSDRGTTVEAVLVDFGYGDPAAKKDPFVVLEKRDGQRVTVPWARLSVESQELAKGDVKKIREAAP